MGNPVLGKEKRAGAPKGGGGGSTKGARVGLTEHLTGRVCLSVFTTGSPTTGGTAGKGLVSLGSSVDRGASAYGAGGGSIIVLPAGAIFAGRQAGGGSRGSIYGTKQYGSGYPYGGTGSGVGGRPFPFGFWPITFIAASTPKHWNNTEYGPALNESRPGGVMTQAKIEHPSWIARNSRKRSLLTRQEVAQNPNATAPYTILGDADSVTSVIAALQDKCGVQVSSIRAQDMTDSAIQPTQMVQYYRASSFGLALSSYYNPDASRDNAGLAIQDLPLPRGTDSSFLACLNSTIGDSVPIMDASAGMMSVGMPMLPLQTGLLALFWVVLCLAREF